MQKLIVAHSSRYAKTIKAIQWLMILCLAACTKPPVAQPTQARPTDQPAQSVEATPQRPEPAHLTRLETEQALIRLIQAERQAANMGDLSQLAQLWAEEALVTDGGGDNNPANDYRWRGRAAVLDRYVVAVFPNPPPLRQETPRLQIEIIDDFATGLDLDSNDFWKFQRQQGRWYLLALTYANTSN